MVDKLVLVEFIVIIKVIPIFIQALKWSYNHDYLCMEGYVD